jgi:excisionase family DNA binding protein
VEVRLDVGRDTVDRWVEQRRLPARKVECLLRFRLREVHAWAEAGGDEGQGPSGPATAVRKVVPSPSRPDQAKWKP